MVAPPNAADAGTKPIEKPQCSSCLRRATNVHLPRSQEITLSAGGRPPAAAWGPQAGRAGSTRLERLRRVPLLICDYAEPVNRKRRETGSETLRGWALESLAAGDPLPTRHLAGDCGACLP